MAEDLQLSSVVDDHHLPSAGSHHQWFVLSNQKFVNEVHRQYDLSARVRRQYDLSAEARRQYDSSAESRLRPPLLLRRLHLMSQPRMKVFYRSVSFLLFN